MGISDTENKLIEIFADVMDADPEEIGLGSTPDDVPDWDSLSNIRLIMSLERAFGIRFSNDEIANWKSIGDIGVILNTKEITG